MVEQRRLRAIQRGLVARMAVLDRRHCRMHAQGGRCPLERMLLTQAWAERRARG